ncbi:LacI family DNA-binding transcriptional regulator [Hypnocyclicus thermotrophus]|uniref:LacI family DNA-binding transcriptional regulator n=1 Tax=Hypnocyclicus thermotrophus TaxID=1627895 RepID=UPI0010649D9A|nr:LacI family DNA-binding transcriptional regulator [Hypnocyclicus thermotrophus]
MKKITIKDIAKLAGVSPSTVSNVINGVSKCSTDTRDNILALIEELNYKPNITAKSLVTKRSKLIGFVFKQDNENSFLQNLLYGIQSGIKNFPEYDIITTNINNSYNLEEWITKRNLDGIIFLGMFSSNLISKIQRLNIPILLIDNYFEQIPNINYVYSEDTLGGYLATEHLIKKKCKHIALATGSLKENELFFRRYLGYKSALEDYGIKLDGNLIFESKHIDFNSGKILGELITQNKNIDGIVSLADILAIGIIKRLNKEYNKIPDDILIIGFDNIPGCEYTTPQLSTIDQGIYEKGYKSINILINKIENNNKDSIEVQIPIKIIERESTKK